MAPRAKSGSRSRRKWILVGVAAFLCVAIGVGVGVGVGVGTKKHKTPATNANASAGQASTDASDITRDQLLGDQARWLGSARSFPVGAAPTTREFNWTVSAVTAAPGGLAKRMIVVNGMSPGPVLEANAGDLLRIHVRNELENTTSIHWHGMLLPRRGFMDGTHGVTQCGIPPGGSFTYEWAAEQGTSWYHAHSGGQYTDGLVGAIVFHPGPEGGPSSRRDVGAEGVERGVQARYDDEATLLLGDAYNTPAPALAWRFTARGTGIDGQPGDEPSPDGGTINGVSQARCAYVPPSDLVIPERKRSYTQGSHFNASNECGDVPTTHYNLTLERGRTYRLRLVNAGSFVNTIFSVDGHALTVVEADGVAVRPLNVSSIELAVGQRYSALITLDKELGAYWIRNRLQTSEMRYTAPDFSETTLGVLRYSGVDSHVMPGDPEGEGEGLGDLGGLAPDTTLVPIDGTQAPQGRAEQYTVQFNMQYTGDNGRYMFFNDSAWEPVAGDADVLRLRRDAAFASSPGTFDGVGDQINIVTPSPSPSLNSSTADYVDLVVNSLDDGSHPFHLHGHRFWVLASGAGHFLGDTSALNTTGVMRRDTLQIPSYGHAVLRLSTRNAGVWAFHCHISWHMQLGLLLTLTHRPDEIRRWALPPGFEEMCAGEREPAANSGAGQAGQ